MNSMEPTTENTTDFWKKFRTGQKSLEQLAEEQGYRPPQSGDLPIVGFMDDEEWEAFTSTIRRWRDESSRE